MLSTSETSSSPATRHLNEEMLNSLALPDLLIQDGVLPYLTLDSLRHFATTSNSFHRLVAEQYTTNSPLEDIHNACIGNICSSNVARIAACHDLIPPSRLLENAARYGNLEAFQTLLNLGVQPTDTYEEATVLRAAVSTNNIALVSYICQKWQLDLILSNRIHLLNHASWCGNVDVLRCCFWKFEAAPGLTEVMRQAGKRGEVALLWYLFEELSITPTWQETWDLFTRLAKNGHLDAIRYLVEEQELPLNNDLRIQCILKADRGYYATSCYFLNH